MKGIKIIVLTTLAFGFVNLSAQENPKKSLFAISAGYAVFNNGEQSGIAFSNEYVRNVNRTLTYGARFMFASGAGNVEGLEPQHNINISTTALDINGFYKPIKSSKHIILLGLGISFDYTRNSSLSNTDYIISDDKIYTLSNTEATISLLEPIFSLHYYYNFSKNLFLGFNINARDLKMYQYIASIGGAVKF